MKDKNPPLNFPIPQTGFHKTLLLTGHVVSMHRITEVIDIQNEHLLLSSLRLLRLYKDRTRCGFWLSTTENLFISQLRGKGKCVQP